MAFKTDPIYSRGLFIRSNPALPQKEAELVASIFETSPRAQLPEHEHLYTR